MRNVCRKSRKELSLASSRVNSAMESFVAGLSSSPSEYNAQTPCKKVGIIRVWLMCTWGQDYKLLIPQIVASQ